MGKIKVGINDFISNLKDVYSKKDNFNVIYNGEVAKKEDTYIKKLIQANSTFYLISGSMVS